MVTLREITRENYLECLRLKVKDSQKNFVASNAFSLAQSKYHSECEPMAIYSDNTMVGFLMHCIDTDDGNHWIWRLMIDERYQGRGYATEAMNRLISQIKSDKSRNSIFISFEPANTEAERLYIKLGFCHTGQIIDDEAVMRLNY